MLNKYDLTERATMGIDCSTYSLAFGIVDEGKLIKWGQIKFDGSTVFDRILDARKKVDALSEQFDVRCIAIESAVVVKSVQVGIKMAYVFGAVLGSLLNKKIKVVEVAPISWQSSIGNGNFSPKEKTELKIAFPGKSKSWYLNKIRELRKDRTRQWVYKTYGQHIESDDITDSIAIANFAYNKFMK